MKGKELPEGHKEIVEKVTEHSDYRRILQE
jgi:hypothetical protein